MASNITNSASFATTNMKPDPGEQADALWAQKIADNTGYLFHQDRAAAFGDVCFVPTSGVINSERYGSWAFATPNSPAYLKGTVSLFKSDSTSSEISGTLYVDGTAAHKIQIAAGNTGGTTGAFSFGISHLAATTYYSVVYKIKTSAGGVNYYSNAQFSAFTSKDA